MKLKNTVISLTLVASLGACTSSVQTTSGRDYNQSVPRGSEMIRAAADVEPLLEFPANFCLAKTENALMVQTEPSEVEIWLNFAARHKDWGTFREISPAVVNLVVSEQTGYRRETGTQEMRAAAARQHCQAILSYEVRKGDGSYVATALLYDVRNSYPYITATQIGGSQKQAVENVAKDVEAAMTALSASL